MNTVKLLCPRKLLPDVMADMMKSGVKYYPICRYHTVDSRTPEHFYILEMDANHKIVSFLILKYGLNQIE